MGHFNFEAEILPLVTRYAERRFRGHPDRDDLVADSASVAWETAETAADTATAGTICRYAIRHVVGRGQFTRSRRSVDRRPADEIVRRDFDPAELSRGGEDPAEIAGFRIDCQDWLATLPRLKRRAAEMLACGTSTGAAARELGVSAARVSQYRRELATSWEVFRL